MKVTVDTERKVIEIDEAVNIADLIKGLEELLGKDWKEYAIEQKTEWMYPWVYPTHPTYPSYPVTYTDNGTVTND